MERYAADRIVQRLARRAGITKSISQRCVRHSFITADLDAGVALILVRRCAMTEADDPWTVAPPMSWPPCRRRRPLPHHPTGRAMCCTSVARPRWLLRAFWGGKCQHNDVEAATAKQQVPLVIISDEVAAVSCVGCT
jgi:hypothetical protein